MSDEGVAADGTGNLARPITIWLLLMFLNRSAAILLHGDRKRNARIFLSPCPTNRCDCGVHQTCTAKRSACRYALFCWRHTINGAMEYANFEKSAIVLRKSIPLRPIRRWNFYLSIPRLTYCFFVKPLGGIGNLFPNHYLRLTRFWRRSVIKHGANLGAALWLYRRSAAQRKGAISLHWLSVSTLEIAEQVWTVHGPACNRIAVLAEFVLTYHRSGFSTSSCGR